MNPDWRFAMRDNGDYGNGPRKEVVVSTQLVARALEQAPRGDRAGMVERRPSARRINMGRVAGGELPLAGWSALVRQTGIQRGGSPSAGAAYRADR
jgi:hypothetical protein